MKKKPLLIFDHDGTLHDSMIIFGPAMRRAIDWLRKQGYEDIPEISDARIASFLGLNSFEIWESFSKDIPEELVHKSADVMNEEVKKELAKGTARWFPGIPETLDRLKSEGYSMVMLTNCEKKLAGFYREHFQTDRWLDKIYDAESYNFLPKSEIIKIILQERGKEAIMVGDRYPDLECAKAGKVPFIGCAYGFCVEGELDESDAIARQPSDLYDCIVKISKERYQV